MLGGMPDRPDPDCDALPGDGEPAALLADLDSVLADVEQVARRSSAQLEAVQTEHRASAENLLSYLALRDQDLRSLQPRLAALGLSSLGRAEGQVLAALRAVRQALRALVTADAGGAATSKMDFDAHLAGNTDALLGPEPGGRRTRIMVTLPSEAARDYALVHDLVQAGMDCARINCAHDDAEAWQAMIGHLRRANEALGRQCRVTMDLGGPKLRTGPLEPGPAVLKVRPRRDDFGRVIAPARVWLAPLRGGQPPPSSADGQLPVARRWLAHLAAGDRVRFVDARGARRRLRVIEVGADGAWAQLRATAYIVPGTVLRRAPRKGRHSRARVGALPAREAPLLLRVGDELVVTRQNLPGRGAIRDERGGVLSPAVVGCSLPEVFDEVRAGERIWFDDGLIGGVIEGVEPTRLVVRIDHARPNGDKLRAEKGINLPDSALTLPALTEKDIRDLEFVVRHADIVSLSFANGAADVEALQEHLRRLGGTRLGIVLKIETRRGFEALPEMLLRLLRSPRFGIMIARGDLAVECGFERLAELQEEILWLCEAAHVPVIWATQVLENLAKTGLPSRAEITDAAMSERAECVMLNKGPHLREAVALLDDILRRMQAHASKKRAMLRSLGVARHFLQGADGSPRDERATEGRSGTDGR
jgi:pyruvate kinase